MGWQPRKTSFRHETKRVLKKYVAFHRRRKQGQPEKQEGMRQSVRGLAELRLFTQASVSALISSDFPRSRHDMIPLFTSPVL